MPNKTVLTKQRINAVIEEWKQTFFDEDMYITKLKCFGDKEFLTFDIGGAIALISQGFATFTDEDMLVMKYPRVRNVTKADMKKFLGDFHVFVNVNDKVVVQFHIDNRELNYYLTFVVETEITENQFKILNFEQTIISTQEEMDRMEKLEKMAELNEKRKAEEKAKREKKKIEQAKLKRMNTSLADSYYISMQKAIKSDLKLCMTTSQIKSLNDISPFISVSDAVAKVAFSHALQREIKSELKKDYSIEEVFKLVIEHKFDNTWQAISFLKRKLKNNNR